MFLEGNVYQGENKKQKGKSEILHQEQLRDLVCNI